MRQGATFDIGSDIEVAHQLVPNIQPQARERHIQFHLERRHHEHQAADGRRIIVGPGGRHHRTQALRDDGDILFRDAKLVLYVTHEFVQILDERRHRGSR
jgi:hypothetical protein